MEINGVRLLKNLEELGKIGRMPNGGIMRAFGSDNDLKARRWIENYWEENLGVKPETDAAANIWLHYGKKEGKAPIVIGSHHDAVPEGGMYDGALGVLIATEILETIKENEVSLKIPISLVSFTGEEPNPFNLSTIGSKILSGRLQYEDLAVCRSRENNESIADALKRAGGDIEKLKDKNALNIPMRAFLECHIEQGKRLEKRQASLATVTCITGIHREMYVISGEANHAGTTVMSDRKDAFLGMAKLSLGLEEIAKDFQDDEVTATVGYAKIEPNEANIIPGKAACIVDIRTCDEEKLEAFVEQIIKLIQNVEKERDVTIQREVILDQPPMPMHEDMIQAVCHGIRKMDEEDIRLVSMAGHDAANMSRITRSGMLFVQSVDGKSHCKEEYTKPEDVVKAAQAMLEAVLYLEEEGEDKI